MSLCLLSVPVHITSNEMWNKKKRANVIYKGCDWALNN
jgi:hypothetical protein